ncbi:peptidoglycan-binding protein [Streptomyces sp. KAU_LT]|uniref:peptidoglycan-binding protein n=1 Tax=Streptomyces sp. KAU_LT TaxID=3046669 RepID=UPI0024B86A0D|nr:peptidoglycan-binding protein [Streptomyces sp. KAU_LT]MDI9831945.1 peptidoglycan-binding protein [Streptomyces sp. KAU_LT]
MSRWAALPAELDPRVRRFVVCTRRVKDHSGLSLRQLAARTGYSQKSWERYLGGRSLPPGEAVEALARAVGEDPTRLLALREVAAEAWRSGRAGPPEPPVTQDDPDGPPPPGRSARVALIAGAVALVLALSTTVLLAVRLSSGEQGRPPAALVATDVPSPASASATAPLYTCRLERVDGHWYAGLSRTRDAILAQGQAGPDVAEAQCLLRRAGLAPGAVDGIFGPVTQRAVEDLQRRDRLVVDGIVGPHTWKALRG